MWVVVGCQVTMVTSLSVCDNMLEVHNMMMVLADYYVMSPPGGRGCYRTPWGLPSVSTCSKQSDYPHLRWAGTLRHKPSQIKTVTMWKVFVQDLMALYRIINVWLIYRVSCKLTSCIFLALQACTLLLTVLFVYDVFFVFITPLFTKVCQDIFLSNLFKCLQSRLLCHDHVTHGIFLHRVEKV